MADSFAASVIGLRRDPNRRRLLVEHVCEVEADVLHDDATRPRPLQVVLNRRLGGFRDEGDDRRRPWREVLTEPLELAVVETGIAQLRRESADASATDDHGRAGEESGDESDAASDKGTFAGAHVSRLLELHFPLTVHRHDRDVSDRILVSDQPSLRGCSRRLAVEGGGHDFHDRGCVHWASSLARHGSSSLSSLLVPSLAGAWGVCLAQTLGHSVCKGNEPRGS